MTSKTWTPGTVVDSPWLQDVNNLTYNLPDNVTAAKGANLVPINSTQVYPNQSSLGFFINKQRRWSPCAWPWLAKFDNVTDDTTTLIQCLTDIYNAGGGTMVCPPGTTKISSLVFNYAAGINVNIEGAGTGATFFTKTGASVTPVLNLSSVAGVSIFNSPNHYEGFTVTASATSPAIRMTNMSSILMEHVQTQSGTIGLDFAGTLVSTFDRVVVAGAATGIRTRKANAIFCNSLTFSDLTVAGCPTYGWDLGDAMDLHIIGGNTEQCGTSGNVNTGGVMIQSTIDDEVGSSIIGVTNHHFENQLGSNFVTAAAAGLTLKLDKVRLLGSEGGRALTIGAIGSFSAESCVADSPGDTVVIAASKSTIKNSGFAVITDTSISRIYQNVSKTTGLIMFGSSLCGSSVLVAGTVAVAGLATKGTEHIFLTSQVNGGTPGFLRITSKGPGGFTITSSNAADTSTVGWFVCETV